MPSWRLAARDHKDSDEHNDALREAASDAIAAIELVRRWRCLSPAQLLSRATQAAARDEKNAARRSARAAAKAAAAAASGGPLEEEQEEGEDPTSVAVAKGETR